MKKICICTGRSCKTFGSRRLTKKVKKLTGVAPGKKSDSIEVEHVPCLGFCSSAPNMQVNDQLHENVQEGDVKKIINTADDNPETYSESRTGKQHDADEIMEANNFLGDL